MSGCFEIFDFIKKRVHIFYEARTMQISFSILFDNIGSSRNKRSLRQRKKLLPKSLWKCIPMVLCVVLFDNINIQGIFLQTRECDTTSDPIDMSRNIKTYIQLKWYFSLKFSDQNNFTCPSQVDTFSNKTERDLIRFVSVNLNDFGIIWKLSMRRIIVWTELS